MNSQQLIQDINTVVATLFNVSIATPLNLAMQLITVFSLITGFCILAQKDVPVAQTARSVFSYLMMLLGIVFMTAAAIATGLATLSQASALSSIQIHVSLLLVFATGGILFLWVDHHNRELPVAAKVVPGMFFSYSLRITTYSIIVFSLLYISIGATYNQISNGGWQLPLMLLLVSGIIAWLQLVTEAVTATPAKPQSAKAVKPTAKKKTAPRKTTAKSTRKKK